MQLARVAAIALLGIGALVLGALVALQRTSVPEESPNIAANGPDIAAIERFFTQPLENLRSASPTSIASLRGRHYTIVNLWATWCTPCREEMPDFVAFRRQYGSSRGVEFVGVAIDRREPVEKFVASHGIDYPIVFAGIEAIELTKPLGNPRMALPFSYVLDAQGKIIQTKLGKLTKEELLAISAK